MTKKINLEESFVSTLGSEQKLKWYLQYDINVVNYLDQNKSNYMAFFDMMLAFIPKKRKLEMIGDMSVGRILKLMENKRPELHKILMRHPKGMSWMNNQIRLFKERFL